MEFLCTWVRLFHKFFFKKELNNLIKFDPKMMSISSFALFKKIKMLALGDETRNLIVFLVRKVQLY